MIGPQEQRQRSNALWIRQQSRRILAAAETGDLEAIRSAAASIYLTADAILRLLQQQADLSDENRYDLSKMPDPKV